MAVFSFHCNVSFRECILVLTEGCRCLQFFESMAVCFLVLVSAGVNLQFIPEFRTLGMALFDMPECDCQGKNGHPRQTSKHVHNSKTPQAFSIVKPPKKNGSNDPLNS